MNSEKLADWFYVQRKLLPSPKFRPSRIPHAFAANYLTALAAFRKTGGQWKIFREIHHGGGEHPAEYIDSECAFAAEYISKLSPRSLLDVGSYRHFLIGLMAGRQVTTLDVRERMALLPAEKVITADAKNPGLPPGSFDMVTCLSTLEHFGLGRYGDEVDYDADRKAFAGLAGLIRPGGHFVFSTTVSRSGPSVVFNAHRIYSRELLRSYATGLELMEERFYSLALRRWCAYEEVTERRKNWDVICACWRKPEAAR